MWDFMSSNEHVFVQSYREGIERVRNSKVRAGNEILSHVGKIPIRKADPEE